METQINASAMKKNDGLRSVLLTFFLIGFIGDVFYFYNTLDYMSDLRLLFFVIFWLFISKVSKFSSTATFKINLVFLGLLSVLFIFFREQPSIDRVASWVYIYLFLGVLQQLFEMNKKNT